MSHSKTPLTVVVFCAFGERQLPDQEHRLLLAFNESVRRHYPSDSRLVLLTDEILNLDPYRYHFDSVSIRRITPSSLLLCRSLSYQEILSNYDWTMPLAFLDYDILMLKRLDSLFINAEDVFLTGRTYSKNMPINGGVLLFNNRRPSACRAFYDSVIQCYTSLADDQLAWWGDQLSLSTATLRNAKIENSDVVLTASGARVRLIPRMLYNFTPYDVDSGVGIRKDLDLDTQRQLDHSVSLAHFKGPRKHLMLAYADRLRSTDLNQSPVDEK